MTQATIVKVESGNVKTLNPSRSGISPVRADSDLSEKVSALIAGDEIQVPRRDGKAVSCAH